MASQKRKFLRTSLLILSAFALLLLASFLLMRWSGAGGEMTFRKITVVVRDDQGNPVEGAVILATGLRVHSRGSNQASWYYWTESVHGPPSRAETDLRGEAVLNYPVLTFPEEKLRTRIVTVSIDHPSFAPASAELTVNATNPTIDLIPGIHLEISGYFGAYYEPVPEIIPNLSRVGFDSDHWIQRQDGAMINTRLAPGIYFIQLSGRLSSGEIVFSELTEFTARVGEKTTLALEMQPGIRLEGRLDDRVPRPVTKGRVLISVRPDPLPLPDFLPASRSRHGYFAPWSTYRPIAEDGSFLFESVPSGSVDLIAHGEGFVSSNGDPLPIPDPTRTPSPDRFRFPQVFETSAPVTRIEVATEPSATLEVTVRTKAGQPVEGADIFVSPNVLRVGGIFGNTTYLTGEKEWRELPELPELAYTVTTDENGFAVFHDLPSLNQRVTVVHPGYQAPLEGEYRFTRIATAPGEVATLYLTLQPKGTDFAGRQSSEGRWPSLLTDLKNFLSDLFTP